MEETEEKEDREGLEAGVVPPAMIRDCGAMRNPAGLEAMVAMDRIAAQEMMALTALEVL